MSAKLTNATKVSMLGVGMIKRELEIVLDTLEDEFPNEKFRLRSLDFQIKDTKRSYVVFARPFYRVERVVLSLSLACRKKEFIRYVIGHELAHVITESRLKCGHQHDNGFKLIESRIMELLGIVLVFKQSKGRRRKYASEVYFKTDYAKLILKRMESVEIAAHRSY